MARVSIAPLLRVTRDGSRTDQDLVAVEAPLSIELLHQHAVASTTDDAVTRTPLGVFMRTPGDDVALAMGLLLAEGLIRSAADVINTDLAVDGDDASATLRVTLAASITVDAAALARSGVASTACGLCGRLSVIKSDLQGHKTRAGKNDTGSRFAEMTPGVVFELPRRLREAQAVFAKTGGLHAAAFFTSTGELVDVTEDVGRHNAVDKLVGRALIAARDQPPAGEHVLVVSGRVAYEIVQKAAMAGVRMLVAVGAPSSLAVQAARESGITLVGFAKDGSYNVYG